MAEGSDNSEDFTRSQVLPFLKKQSEAVNAMTQGWLCQQEILIGLFQGIKLSLHF